MKTFSTSGTGNQQTLSEIESNNVPIYDSMADVTADLANLTVGQIVATKDTGDELAQPVDVVESGNLHAVTSNAVAEMFLNSISNDFVISFSNKTANVTGILYLTIQKHNTRTVTVQEDNVGLIGSDVYASGIGLIPITVFIRKGHQYKVDNSTDTEVSIYMQKFIPLFS